MVACYWCGSRDTHFSHYTCWDEDERGNPIQIEMLDSLAAAEYADRHALSIRDEEWWCNECAGYFGGPVADASEGEASS